VISLASLAAISFVAWVYLAFAHGRFWCGDQRLEGGERAPAKWPDVIAIVPARNESAVIERSLRSLLQQDYPGQFSVILVDDESSDDTAGVARACASAVGSDVPLQILSTSARPTGWVGKMWALETGVSAAGR